MGPPPSKATGPRAGRRGGAVAALALALLIGMPGGTPAAPAAKADLTVRQGGVGRIDVTIPPGDSAPWGSFLGRTVYFRPDGGRRFTALLGVDVDGPEGPHPLKVMVVRDGATRVLARPTVEVRSGDFGTQRLTLPKDQVDLDPPTLARVAREQTQVRDLWRSGTPKALWDGTWRMPVAGQVMHSFGFRRIINGEPRSPHNGEDIAAPLGTPVVAPNDGVARLTGERFFGGETVFLEHGAGLFTFYMHLSDIEVKDGQQVKKGDVIGKVGQTGRATGPHLHWGGRLNDARINPLHLVGPEPRLEIGDGLDDGPGGAPAGD
jgi:Peptidase family M23